MPDALIDQFLGRYHIHQEIGRGGMARVYRATDTQLKRTVALKVLTANLADDPEFARRFEREAVTVANLRHPSIITVFDIGESEGRKFIAMEYIAGRTLHDVIVERGSLGLALATGILTPVAQALHYAHTRGAIHRDVKPHNIMIDVDGRVLLADFGIALGSRDHDQRLTQTGVFMGTPEYLSPEQIQADPLTAASDQYALGVVAFECLTGRVPFKGSTAQLLMAHVYSPPPRATSLLPTLPPALDQVLNQALAKDPAKRYSSTTALAAAIEAVARQARLAAPRQEQLAALAIPGGSSAGKQTQPIDQADSKGEQRVQAAVDRPFPISDMFGPAPRSVDVHPQVAAAPSVGGPSVAALGPPPAPPLGRLERTSWRPTASLRPGWVWPSKRGDRLFGGLIMAGLALLAVALALQIGRNREVTASRELRAAFAASATPEPAPTDGQEFAATATAAPSLPTATPPAIVPPSPESGQVAGTSSPERADRPLGGGASIVFQSDTALNLLDIRANTNQELVADARPIGPAAIAPDGSRVLFDRGDAEQRRIWIYTRDTRSLEQLPTGEGEAFHPAWSPDGKQVVYAGRRNGQADLFLLTLETNQVVALTDDPAEDDYPSFNPRTGGIIWESQQDGRWRILLMERDGVRRVVEPAPGSDDRYPRLSPDGFRLIFSSNRRQADRLELYMQPLAGGLPTHLPDQPAGSSTGAHWSPDSQYIVFSNNADGNENLYRYKLFDGTVSQLSSAPQDERWPVWGP